MRRSVAGAQLDPGRTAASLALAKRKFPAACCAGTASQPELNREKASRLGLRLGADDRWSRREASKLNHKEGQSIRTWR